ncbi:MAG TPA: hypothetical protein VLE95_08960 [Chlamydiales bacterium]|nr:hypothetical protein [Chlamydiales bacterium]
MPKKLSLARPGNKNGVILKDPAIRQLAYKDFCKHIANGYPQECWSFDQDGYRCSYQTMLAYIKNDTVGEFDPILKEQAHSKSYKKLYGVGLNLMTGKIQGGSPVVWQTIMRNVNRRFGWDREEIIQDSKTHVERLAQSIRSEVVPEAEAGDSGIESTD